MTAQEKKILPSVKVWESTLKLLKGEQNRRYQETGVEPVYAEMVHAAVELWLANSPASNLVPSANPEANPREITGTKSYDHLVTLVQSVLASFKSQLLSEILDQNAKMLGIFKATGKQGGKTRSNKHADKRQLALERETARLVEGVEDALRSKRKTRDPGKALGKKARGDDKPIPRVAGK